jgi:hypothetical protein
MKMGLSVLPRQLLVVLLAVCGEGQAALVYENLGGNSFIYDTLDQTTWTQDGNLAGQTLDWQAAQNWATSLSFAGVTDSWMLPSEVQFTSLYTQLFPYGAPGTQSNKYGTQVLFGSGANDFALNVQSQYWTTGNAVDFNFFYGYPGVAANGTAYSAWAVAPEQLTFLGVPLPATAGLFMAGFMGLLSVIRHRNSLV